MERTPSQVHQTFAQAYVQGLRDVLKDGYDVPPIEDPNSVGSHFGRSSRRTLELFGYSFEVADPWSSLVLSRERPVRLPFCIGLFLWTVAGSDDERWISYYNPRAADFSDDGVHITAAFGKRLFAYEGRVDQIEAVFKRLSMDSQTRRTVATVIIPEDNQRDVRDYPCAIAVQYLQRDNALHALTYMRSQSALMVLPYDAFLFMTLQCWLASRMQLKVGTYKHVAGSFHIYEDEFAVARRVVEAGAESARLGDMPVPDARMDSLLAFEKELRAAALAKSLGDIRRWIHKELEGAKDTDTSFFTQARRILLVHAALRLDLGDEIGPLLSSIPQDIRTGFQLFDIGSGSMRPLT